MPAGGPGFAIPGLVSKGHEGSLVEAAANQRSWVPRENEISFGRVRGSAPVQGAGEEIPPALEVPQEGTKALLGLGMQRG